MQERRQKDYIKFLLLKAIQDLSGYELKPAQVNLVQNLFNKFISEDDLLRNSFLLSQVKGFENLGKYLIYILKKLNEGVIKYENLSQNILTDTAFIEAEILNYFSYPSQKTGFSSESNDDDDEAYGETIQDFSEEQQETEQVSPKKKTDKKNEEKERFDNFKKHYLELIQSEPEEEDESVYDLPESKTEMKEEEPEFYDDYSKELYESQRDDAEAGEEEEEETIDDQQETETVEELEELPDEYDEALTEEAGAVDLISSDEEFFEKAVMQSKPEEEVVEKIYSDESTGLHESILDEEVSGILDEYKHEDKKNNEPEKPTNAVFLQYEDEVKKKNEQLKEGFEDMLDYLFTRSKDRDLREKIIKNILEISTYLEEYSRKLSLEIITKVYQTISLSFEKISEGQYDISDQTLKLFKSSLDFVLKLLKGEDYFTYEATLRSIESLRSSLIEEKEQREKEIQSEKEKQELELILLEKYPESSQREKVKELKIVIKDIQKKFDSIEEITGEYQIFEATRNLNGNLPNIKELVSLSKDLNIPKLAQLAEGIYIFIKFLQNYRINPVNPEIREIFRYIIHNLKMLIFDKHSKELDLFISYLNDPVKIFSKHEKKDR